MADGERDWTEKEIVLEARKKPLRSFEELMAACLPALTARLWATCCWSASLGKSWKIGDYNFLIASVSPDPQSTLYIQFWSEPLEPVLTEVCSGEWNPGAVRYLRQQQRKQLGALGYTLGGQARNFGKEVQIRTSAQAEAAAREVLAIFYDVFGYRGQWPLEVECHQGERADLDTVYSSLTPEDLTKLAAHLGFDADVVEDSDPSVVHRAGKETIRREPGRSGGRQPSLFRGGVPDPHQLRHRHRSDRVRGSRRCRPVLAGSDCRFGWTVESRSAGSRTRSSTGSGIGGRASGA